MTKAINIPEPTLTSEQASSFDISYYMEVFDKININTFFWQIIVVFSFWWFHKEIMELARALIKKIPDIKSVGKTEFDVSETAKEVVEQESRRLDKMLKAYDTVVPNDERNIYLAIFKDSEDLLRELHYLNFDTKMVNLMSPSALLNDLGTTKSFNLKHMEDFKSAVALNQQLKDNEQMPIKIYNIELFSRTLLLLNDRIINIIRSERTKKRKSYD